MSTILASLRPRTGQKRASDIFIDLGGPPGPRSKKIRSREKRIKEGLVDTYAVGPSSSVSVLISSQIEAAAEAEALAENSSQDPPISGSEIDDELYCRMLLESEAKTVPSKRRTRSEEKKLQETMKAHARGPNLEAILESLSKNEDNANFSLKKCVSKGYSQNFQSHYDPTDFKTNFPVCFDKVLNKSCNIVHYLSTATRALSCATNNKTYIQRLSAENFGSLIPHSMRSPFSRRVTALTYHPYLPHLVAAASKGGEVAYFNTTYHYNPVKVTEGIGPGGSVVAMKYHPRDPSCLYTAAITGKVRCENYVQQFADKVIIDSGSWLNWFCSLDLLPERKLLMTGNCTGFLYLITDNGDKVLLKKKVHKGKVSHVEFCQKSPNLFLTSSADKMVKLWDLRMFSQSTAPLHSFGHSKGINSAYFNPACTSVLTTDQHHELRVYTGPSWNLEALIPHPHRHFQHLTPIKAAWCPWGDSLVVGRYPDDQFQKQDLRTIDFYDGHTGKEIYRLFSESVPGITSLNTFNCNGDTLFSGSGYSVIFWSMKKHVGLKCNDEPKRPTKEELLRYRRKLPFARN